MSKKMPKKQISKEEYESKKDINSVLKSAMIMAEKGKPTLALDILEGLKSMKINVNPKKLNEIELYIAQYLNAGGASSQISQ